MPEPHLDPALLAIPPDRPAYKPYPEIARAIRAQVQPILDEWRGRTLFSMPDLGELTIREFQNDVARILAAIADALESNEPPDLKRLMQTAPSHGFQRFFKDYDLADLFAEQRVLRRVVVARVQDFLERVLRSDEGAALHAMIDIMLQQGVLALVQQQQHDIKLASEIQLKYLSFLSHDLTNNFLVIASNLEVLQDDLRRLPEMHSSSELIAAALGMIHRTNQGMRRLLEHERLRHASAKPRVAPAGLLELIKPVVTLAASDARGRRLRIDMDIDPQAIVETNADLFTIILQNLIGNAVKHAARGDAPGAPGDGHIRVTARPQPGSSPASSPGWWTVSVIDDGPGIPKDQIDRLFKAFEQIPSPDEGHAVDRGFGLGLAIASQAARLLGTSIEVTTAVGVGSTFSIRLPAVDSH